MMATYLDDAGLKAVWNKISSNFARGNLAVYHYDTQPKEADVPHKPALIVLKNGAIQYCTE